MAKAALALILPLLLAACSPDAAPPAADGAERIACALGEGAQFAPLCAVERTTSADERLVIVRHPDGGFRRFALLPDGRGLAAADGADLAQQEIAGGLLEVRVGADRYRFPIKLKAPATPAPAGNVATG
jgi:hypothetical protein